ncbi:hypothetical protein [Actinosynnema mirum]|uniref:Uncharacterized protein n=1 Tax=Actinosynnema mirum (strain ATCC 29888 / DSM 43827 / JCM 3225 / NBRC 14064 / NCIMB 13271 / NRRL B-12336 / IMRU 3971 / 101) TaxID=446462 RepID=C6W9U4_ACTMD|nr:hypothetical protein [Actinosynnema mirum]ACU37311.1 hypothetical protein Amir_3413 [Actinosynnema mirum DSM 43827]
MELAGPSHHPGANPDAAADAAVAPFGAPGTEADPAAADPTASRRPRREEARHCAWCGRPLPDQGRVGRPRRYCAQPCRQRAYERRAAVQRGGLPEDAVVLSAAELADLQDRLFQLRCAAEDVASAAAEGADPAELGELATGLADTARGLERLR